MTQQVIKCVDRWMNKNNLDNILLKHERKGILEILTHWDILDIKGGAILINGTIEAFSFGELLCPDIAVIHIEKANTNIAGIYQAINRYFIQNEWSNTVYINREEDMGIPNLKKAKQSYRPISMVEKYIVNFL